MQRRSSLTFDPHVSGYKWGQIYSDVDGAYWTPARLDMDTMLSKVDPGMIDNVTVIPGPYGVSYGPGFAFIDVNRTPTPRHDCFQANSETSLNVNSNGGQIYARETVTGGGSDWGFLGSYGERDGNDYLAGNSQKMPSEYHAHDAWGEVGYDINPHQHLDFTYTRLDMADTQIPGQFFDIGELSTNGFLVRIVNDDPDAPWTKLSIAGWYNSTGFSGSTAGNGGNDPNFPVVLRINSSLDQQYYGTTNQLTGTTDGFQYSTGLRMGLVFGDKDSVQLRTGADCRYLGQTINENFMIETSGSSTAGAPPSPFQTNMPQSYMVDPGMYAELSLPVTDLWTVSLGGRVNYVRTNALSVDLRGYSTGTYQGSLVGVNQDFSNTNILQRSDVLPAFYLTNRCKLGDHWLLTAGVGEAERPPTLIERLRRRPVPEHATIGLDPHPRRPPTQSGTRLAVRRCPGLQLRQLAEPGEHVFRLCAELHHLRRPGGDCATRCITSRSLPGLSECDVRRCEATEFREHTDGEPGRFRDLGGVRRQCVLDAICQGVLYGRNRRLPGRPLAEHVAFRFDGGPADSRRRQRPPLGPGEQCPDRRQADQVG